MSNDPAPMLQIVKYVSMKQIKYLFRIILTAQDMWVQQAEEQILQSSWCQFKALAAEFLQPKKETSGWPTRSYLHRDAVKMWNPVVYSSLVPPVGSASSDHNAQRHWAPSNILIPLESVGMEVLGKYFLKDKSLSFTIQTVLVFAHVKLQRLHMKPSFLSWKSNEKSHLFSSSY